MRFGGPVFGWSTPTEWIGRVRACGYRTAYCPVDESAPEGVVAAFRAAAASADITIAEVGIWRNVLDRNPARRQAAVDYAKARLALADRIGAGCAVNIAGSRGDQWDGPDARNYSDETFDMTVSVIREIIDDVRPLSAKYALETMPWMVPDSAESSLALVRAVDRKAFAIHFDPVNIVNSPRTFYANGEMIRDFIDRVGEHIVAIHLKDIVLRSQLTVHLDEVRPGLGGLDIHELLHAARRLHPDTPVLLEHLPNEEEYELARRHVFDLLSEHADEHGRP